MKSIASLVNLLSVLFSFCIIGFCNIVGVATSYVQNDFGLSDTMAGLLPVVVFGCFLFLSVPAMVLMGKIGYRKTVLAGMLLILAGMLVAYSMHNYPGCLAGFFLLGMGNVFLQIALNPLLACVVSGEAMMMTLTFGQMIKAVSSFCGPFLAAFAVSIWSDWHNLFLVFAIVTLLSALWLSVTFAQEDKRRIGLTSGQPFGLLKTEGIPALFLAAVLVVGVDVGMNVLIPKLMMGRCGHTVQDAALGVSVYFAFRTLGLFASTILLAKLSEIKYIRIHVFIALLSVLLLFFAKEEHNILTLAGVVGFSISVIFDLICSIALRSYPDKVNEVSALMMISICGGAFIPLLMGVAADWAGSQTGSLVVIAVCILYLMAYFFGVTYNKMKV